MDSVNRQVSTDDVADVLGAVRKKGVTLWSENGQLHYAAPKGALTREEIQRLRASKAQIVALLEGVTAPETGEENSGCGPQHKRAPLAYSQLAHWQLYRLGERHAIRQIASATRLHGRLNIAALRRSAIEIVNRHEALRTRIVVRDGTPVQEVGERGDVELRMEDLSALSEASQEVQVNRLIAQLILEPIDVTVGPLFEMRLLRLRGDEHVLVVVMEHMISDAFSMNILLRDLIGVYRQISKGRAPSLSQVSVQFTDYAVWQRIAEQSWIAMHGAYWNERLAGCKRLRFPEARTSRAATRAGWVTVPIRIRRNLKQQLREWCRLRQTTLTMCVFTAYVALVLRWCGAAESIVLYQSDGRVSPELQNTIGYFATPLYLRVELRENDSFVDLMRRLTEEYCKAYEHADFSHMTAQRPRPEFTRNTIFNWVPEGSNIDLSGLDGSEGAVTCSPVRFAYPMRRDIEPDNEPTILLYDVTDEIVGGVYFPLSRFSVDTMERFSSNFLLLIRALLRQPNSLVKDILIVR